MKKPQFHCLAITLAVVAACNSNEVDVPPQTNYSRGGSAGVAGAVLVAGQAGRGPEASGNSGRPSAANAGSGAIVADAAAGNRGSALGASGGSKPTSGGALDGKDTGGSPEQGMGGAGDSPVRPETSGTDINNPIGFGGTSGNDVAGTSGTDVAGMAGTSGNDVAGTAGTAGFTPTAICSPGSTKDCTTGSAGICAAGKMTCDTTGRWGGCVQAHAKGARDCNSSLDNDCDGAADSAQVELYRIDADQDGYCTAGSLSACKGSQPSTAILSTACLGTDCSDSTFFRNVSCVPCVTGLVVTEGDALAPSTFEKIDVNLNSNASAVDIWLWKRMVDDAPCLTDIEISFSDKKSPIPFGSDWVVSSIDLNDGNATSYNIRIGWKSVNTGTPIQDINVMSLGGKITTSTYGTSGSSTWHVAQWTKGSNSEGNADLDKDVGGDHIYVLYLK